MSGIVPEIGGFCEGYSDVRSANYMGYICDNRNKDTKGGLIFSKPFLFKGKTQYIYWSILQTIRNFYSTIKPIILLFARSLNGLLILITQLNLATSPTLTRTRRRRLLPSSLSQREQSTIKIFNQPKPQSLPAAASPKEIINKIYPAFKSKSEEGGERIEISEGKPQFLGEIKQGFGGEP